MRHVVEVGERLHAIAELKPSKELRAYNRKHKRKDAEEGESRSHRSHGACEGLKHNV